MCMVMLVRLDASLKKEKMSDDLSAELRAVSSLWDNHTDPKTRDEVIGNIFLYEQTNVVMDGILSTHDSLNQHDQHGNVGGAYTAPSTPTFRPSKQQQKLESE